MAPQRPDPWLYRALFLCPLLAYGYLISSGHWSLPFSNSVAAGPSGDFGDSLLWLASLAPLIITSLALGSKHVGARRHGYDLFVGLRETFRRAIGGQVSPETKEAFGEAPRDNPGAALAIAAVIAVLLPVFFASVIPDLRTGRRLFWLSVAGVLAGSLAYARHRAMAYLRDEPDRWDVFRAYRLLNPDRYEDAGRSFVRWQLIGAAIFGLWWLVGGSFLVWSS